MDLTDIMSFLIYLVDVGEAHQPYSDRIPKAAFANASAASPKYAVGRKSGACLRTASR